MFICTNTYKYLHESDFISTFDALVVLLILDVAVVVVALILGVAVVATMVNVEALKIVLTPILDIAVILITTPASPLPIELVATTENV